MTDLIRSHGENGPLVWHISLVLTAVEGDEEQPGFLHQPGMSTDPGSHK